MRYYVRQWREKLLLSQEGLYRKTRIARDGISRIERGLQEPRPGTVRKLARGLGISVDEMRRDPFERRRRRRKR